MWLYSSSKPIFSVASEMPMLEDWSKIWRSVNVAAPRSWASDMV